ncbi:hypothetical protein SAMN05519105_0686 [Rhodobacter sp. 24-YEA-8]|nr:hypothetical protein SAMN05519105_0686 [Rhodobacter sp. 24-YEA-8]
MYRSEPVGGFQLPQIHPDQKAASACIRKKYDAFLLFLTGGRQRGLACMR